MTAQADRYFARLVDYIYVQFPHSKPDIADSVNRAANIRSFSLYPILQSLRSHS